MSPSGRNPIGRRRARRLPSRSEEAAINPHANASPIDTPMPATDRRAFLATRSRFSY